MKFEQRNQHSTKIEEEPERGEENQESVVS